MVASDLREWEGVKPRNQFPVIPQYQLGAHRHQGPSHSRDILFSHQASINEQQHSGLLPTIHVSCENGPHEHERPYKRARLSDENEYMQRRMQSLHATSKYTSISTYDADPNHTVAHIAGERCARSSQTAQKELYHYQQSIPLQNTAQIETASGTGLGDKDRTTAVANEVCFGMLEKIPIVVDKDSPVFACFKGEFTTNCRLLGGDGLVVQEHDQTPIGSVSGSWLKVLLLLIQEKDITLQTRCRLSNVKKANTFSSTRAVTCQVDASLEAIIYGPLIALDDIGDFLEESCVFLQDPKGCTKNVPYRNPQRLSGLTGVTIMTQQFGEVPLVIRKEEWHVSQGYLDNLEFRTNLPLAPAPSALKTDLFDHQKRALYFMQERERGWNLDGSTSDLWSTKMLHGSLVYLNNLTQEIQSEPPPAFRGGLLADGMGLGKTLSMISLIASDLDGEGPQQALLARKQCTLVIVPPNLLQTWYRQCLQHSHWAKLVPGIHHGSQRMLATAAIADYNVILTSYHTVAHEWKKRSLKSSVLYSYNWHRVILDEAHLIRDKKSQIARAVCAISAKCRWAVTGTPIQNHVADFVGLLQFLRPYPYHQQQKFDEDIIQLWKIDAEAAIARFQKLITTITLRRTNGTIDLPPRVDEVHHVQLSPPERDIYDQVEQRTRDVVNRPSRLGDSEKVMGHNALRGLNCLRSICNHGTLTDISKFDLSNDAISNEVQSHTQDILSESEHPEITKCKDCLNGVFSLYDGPKTPFSDVDYASPASSATPEAPVVCFVCLRRIDSVVDIGLFPNPSTPSSLPLGSPCVATTEDTPVYSDSTRTDSDYVPMKAKTLVQDLQKHQSSKSVVFSFWSTTLTMIAKTLHTAGLSYVRFDGTLSAEARIAALDDFRAHSAIKVILLTISCGAVGLDLTVADRVYLIEPQWNPTVEDQAMARIHRLGQKKPVTTVRFVVDDTIEQRVIELQKRKRNFADLLLSSKKSSNTASKHGQYQYLRSLLS